MKRALPDCPDCKQVTTIHCGAPRCPWWRCPVCKAFGSLYDDRKATAS